MTAQRERAPYRGQILARWQGKPTVLCIALGSKLRRLREASGVTRGAAGYVIRGSSSKIGWLERGRGSFKERDVADLLTLYGITDEQEREVFLTLVRQANTPGWWQEYGDVLPNWFETYLGLEQAALAIRTYEPALVPGDGPSRIPKAKGKLRGKQPKLSARQQAYLVELHAAGKHTVVDLVELFNVSRPTVYRVLERHQARHSASDPAGIPDMTDRLPVDHCPFCRMWASTTNSCPPERRPRGDP